MEWLKNYNKAFIKYQQEDYRAALSFFRKALEKCPVQHEEVNADIMYHVGDCLIKLSKRGAGLRFWKVALRYITDEEQGLKILDKINSYGMVKRENYLEDDYSAFKAIQLMQYLGSKLDMRFSNFIEKDMIMTLLKNQFEEIEKDAEYNNLTSTEKVSLFKSYKIVFPFIIKREIRDIEEHTNIILFDFKRKVKIKSDIACSCGSGLNYSLCCGCVPEIDNILSDTN